MCWVHGEAGEGEGLGGGRVWHEAVAEREAAGTRPEEVVFEHGAAGRGRNGAGRGGMVAAGCRDCRMGEKREHVLSIQSLPVG